VNGIRPLIDPTVPIWLPFIRATLLKRPAWKSAAATEFTPFANRAFL
jgi:hypothetical protein